MLTLQNLDVFKEELIIINYNYNFIVPKTVFWESLETYNYIKTYLFLKRYRQRRDKFTNLKELKDLQIFDLYSNQLTTVPNFNLPNLQTLVLDNNQLTTVPDFNLPSLQKLSLRNNQLTTVPNFNLPSLQILDFDNNQLTTVPDFNLPNLGIFYLNYNQLTEEEKERLKEKYENKLIKFSI